MQNAKLIILRGYPGSGKTTVGKALQSEEVGVFIDHNAILTFVATIAGDDKGIYDEIVALEQGITRKLLNEGKCVIIARGFSSINSIDPYVKLAEDMDTEARIIRLAVDDSELMKRVQSPERKQDFNPTTTAAYLEGWMSNHPLEEYPGEIVVNNEQPLALVIREIFTSL